MPQPLKQTITSPHIREKRRRRRAEILRAALWAFREKGYHATTLDDIAGRVGIRKTALYHYFPDKESILYVCHRESLAEVAGFLAKARKQFTLSGERLGYVIRQHARLMTDTLEGSPLAFEVTALSPKRQREIIAARDRYERGLREIITEGVTTGEFRPVNPKIAVFAILGAINWIARWYRPNGSIRGAELGVEFSDLLVGGLICSE